MGDSKTNAKGAKGIHEWLISRYGKDPAMLAGGNGGGWGGDGQSPFVPMAVRRGADYPAMPEPGRLKPTRGWYTPVYNPETRVVLMDAYDEEPLSYMFDPIKLQRLPKSAGVKKGKK